MDKWINRPWGRYKTVWESKTKKAKILEVFSGQRISLQYHNHRKEIWTLLQGEAMVNINGMNLAFNKGERITVGKKAIHRISNRGWETVVVFEIQEGLCREKDIVRLEDDYGRPSNGR
jgi:mannose-6-phosphate isomerase